MEYNWSKYQRDIFDFVEHGVGNCVVEACAGSGKSTTMIKCIDLIPKGHTVLLTAFNKDIVDALSSKLERKDNVRTMTIHSIGLKMLINNLKDSKLKLDEFKYRTYINSNISDISETYNNYNQRNKDKYIKNINKFVDFGRLYLCQTVKDLSMIENRYGIQVLSDEKDIAVDVMKWGKNNTDIIDYTDMIWLPNVLYLQPWGFRFDWVMVDECQDLNRAQRELILKCNKINTRILAFGDEKQCIYSFSGSDPESFNELRKMPNTITLPLSITYRCADKIVELARTITDVIEPNDFGNKGIILYDTKLEDIENGDMVLCRNNSPLVQAYSYLVNSGKKCFIRGRDFGIELISIIKSTKCDYINKDLSSDGVIPRLYADLIESINTLKEKSNITDDEALDSEYILNKVDIIKIIEILSTDLNSAEELINKIDSIFSDKWTDGIMLSTIHKAKGLESKNVHILCRSLMPSKNATEEWEKEQEMNLMYVAYTRAINKLCFVKENGFQNIFNTEKISPLKIRTIEQIINKIIINENNTNDNNTVQTTVKTLVKPKVNIKILK